MMNFSWHELSAHIPQGSADFHRDTPMTVSTPSPPPCTPPLCSLASSAQQFMQRKRQAAEQENMQQTECPEPEMVWTGDTQAGKEEEFAIENGPLIVDLPIKDGDLL